MALQNPIGQFLYGLRTKRHMTQEELSFGICSVGTISRIENGSQVPSGSLLRLLLEKLGEPGFFSGLYYSKDFLEGRILEREMLLCFENLDRAGFEEAFDLYNRNHLEENKKCSQFGKFIRYIYLESLGGVTENPEKILTDILRISQVNYRSPGDLLYSPDKTETLILNSLALYFAGTNQFDKAKVIFLKLIGNVNENRELFSEYLKVKAALYNNLCLSMMGAGRFYQAGIAMDKADELSKKEGGLVLRLKIMTTRAFLNEKTNQIEKAARDRYLIRMSLREIMKNPQEIWDSMGLFNDGKGIVAF